MLLCKLCLLVCHEMHPVCKFVLGDPRVGGTAGNVHGHQDGDGIELRSALGQGIKSHCLFVYKKTLVGPGIGAPGIVKVDCRVCCLAIVGIVVGRRGGIRDERIVVPAQDVDRDDRDVLNCWKMSPLLVGLRRCFQHEICRDHIASYVRLGSRRRNIRIRVKASAKIPTHDHEVLNLGKRFGIIADQFLERGLATYGDIRPIGAIGFYQHSGSVLNAVGNGRRQFLAGAGSTSIVQGKANQTRDTANGTTFRIWGKRLSNRNWNLKAEIRSRDLFRDTVGAPFWFL
mmetsp:Transcript_4224/g.8772  ORF Transcript_4224/g.8772 Transcript_4224/m.8772 type:complete len:286 (-) Transcript_4224:184-1041(-)